MGTRRSRVPSASLPSPEVWCGQHFRYRDLMEVGSTWEKHRIDNRPRQRATYDAMQALCAKVLDPVHVKFGPPLLTYAFAAPALDKLVRRNPNPNTTRNRDQHAGCELNGNGKPFCPRLGIAVDLQFSGRGSAEVARWIAENTQFDRLYFYADGRPFHVSVGPENARQIMLMSKLPSGRFVPRKIPVARFGRIVAAASQ